MRSLAFALLAVTVTLVCAQSADKGFTMYFVDVEGGQSVIYISPAGNTLVMDSGYPGGRDAGRILDALNDANVKEIDYLVSTHYDLDHIGGVKELADHFPIWNFVDHGASVAPQQQLPGFLAAYAGLYSKANHHTAKVGEKIAMPGLDVLVVTAANQVLKTPLRGAGSANTACAGFRPHDEPDDENAESVGLLFTYGKFRTINLGDLTWNTEFNLMCPNNPIGGVDLFVTPNHGQDRSGSPTLVHGLRPLIAVMNNGPRKGGTPQTLTTLHTSPNLEDVWQLHWGDYSGLEYNTPGQFIANVDDAATAADVVLHPVNPPPLRGRDTPPPSGGTADRSRLLRPTGHTPAWWIKVTAHADGTFTVLNPRNNFSKTYHGGRWQQ
jgi:beta-lactamase superfamily II metal-dependent hydrolase